MPGPVFYPTHDAGQPVIRPADVREALPAIGVGLFAGLGGFLFGYDTGVISGLLEMPQFGKQFGKYWDNVPQNPAGSPARPGYALSTSGRSLVVSILSVGTFFGALFAAPLGDFFGRRAALKVSIVVFALGVLIQAVGHSISVFALGRVCAGLGVGMVSVLVPLYQAETAPRWCRGAVVTCYQWSITIGLLISSIADNGTKDNKGASSYLIPICLQFVWGALVLAGLFFLPETPRFRIKQGRDDEAAKILAFLNSRNVEDPAIKHELKLIKDAYEEEMRMSTGQFSELFSRGENNYRSRVILACALQALQQLTGINFIFYYGTVFFKSTGARDPFTFSIISNVVNVVSTVPGMWATERLGRRKLFITGAIGMFVAQMFVAVIGTAATVRNRPAQRAAVGFVCIYISFFAATWGPLTWVHNTEIFPLQIRGMGVALSTASQWALNCAIGASTPYLVDSGPGKAGLGPRVFFVWSGFCLVCIFVSYFFVYEAKGLSLEEVDTLFSTSKPWTSARRNAEIQADRAQLELASGGSGSAKHKDDESA